MAVLNGSKTPDVNITAAADVAAVSTLIKELSALGEGFNADSDEKTRLALLNNARTLFKALETPRETMIRHCWAQPAAMCALTAGTHRGIWTYLAEHDGPFKAAEVAKVKGIDPPMLCKYSNRLPRGIG